MSEQENTEIVEENVTPPPAPEGGEVDSTHEPQPAPASAEPEPAPQPEEPDAVSKLAQEMGWSPKDAWRGNPELWKPADQFIRETHNINSHLKSELHNVKRDFETRTERNERMAKQALETQRRQIEESYEARMLAAAADADMDSYKAAMEGKSQALKNFDEQTKEPEQSQPQAGADEAVQEFIARNRSWYEQDPVMTGAAQGAWGDYQSKFPSLPLSQIANMVEEDLRKTFPQKFPGAKPGNTQQPNTPPVEGGLRPISGAQKKGWDTLPAEAKRAGENFIAEGLFGDDKAKAKAAYAEQYYAQ